MTAPPHTTDPSVSVERRHNYPKRVFMWLLAPLVEKWSGLSLTRFLAIYVAIVTNDVAHDWIEKCVEKGTPLGWAFVGFLLGGFFLAAVLAFGAKYFDKFLEIVATKVGVALAAKAPGGVG